MKVKWVLSSALALSLFGSGVYAGTVLQTYKTVRGDFATVEREDVHKNRIALTVDGVKASKPTWYANDTTYVPLRDAAELLSVNVNYNRTTMTAELTKNSSPAAPPTGTVGTRSNPVPFNQKATVNVNIYDSQYNEKSALLDITVNRITRGSTALNLIKAENPYNETPPSGYEYVIIHVDGKIRNATTNDYAFNFDQWDFEAVSQNGNSYNIPSVVTPDDLNEDIFNNGSSGGNMVWIVKANDNVLLNFEDANGKNVFFSTK